MIWTMSFVAFFMDMDTEIVFKDMNGGCRGSMRILGRSYLVSV